ncbi:hypothetical protein C3481_13520 [Microbacterium sp. Ru50]|uniref:MaoC/PaaZ C-terminal domain-containing protein n=1 Tax=Microbacterium sp. Ru50 TaxID=2080744 RepID=UPI000CDE3F73|nr:MaoC/PaaZ C-terminal domain-containing protein [Microbacterium sp. Ru50]POX65904.1 hypothetical protein C3481_13520 [Microbacterium sp. Ru50]
MTAIRTTVAGLPELIGTDLGATPFEVIAQAQVDDFAALSGDAQWIHVDPQRAAAIGGTIVHGLLLLSLVGGAWGRLVDVTDAGRALNYGLDRVRFLAPVPVGSEVRIAATVADVTPRPDGMRVSLDLRFETRSRTQPVAVATSIVLFPY